MSQKCEMSTVALTFSRPTASSNRSMSSSVLMKANSNGSSSIASSRPRSAAWRPTSAWRRPRASTRSPPAGGLRWNMYSPGTKQRFLAAELGGEIDDVLRPLDMIGADGRVEIAEAETGADQRIDRQPRSANVGDILAAFRRRHPARVEADEKIEAVETDPLCFPPARLLPRMASRTRPNRSGRASIADAPSSDCSSLDKTIADDHFAAQGARAVRRIGVGIAGQD